MGEASHREPEGLDIDSQTLWNQINALARVLEPAHAALHQIQQGVKVIYREAHMLLEELADATLDGNRQQHF